MMLWARLRGRLDDKPVFRRQHPIGPFVLDFFCAKAKLAIEIDGEGHVARLDRDRSRDAWLRARGLTVMRFGGGEVLRDPAGVAEAIIVEAQARSERP